MVGGIVAFATSLTIRLSLLDFFPAWIPRASFPLASELCLAAFSSQILMTISTSYFGKPMPFLSPALPPMKKPRGEIFDLSSRDFHGVVDTINDFF
jgi:hypothetical protein